MGRWGGREVDTREVGRWRDGEMERQGGRKVEGYRGLDIRRQFRSLTERIGSSEREKLTYSKDGIHRS